ncbi:hypothetical protein FQ330_11745 [Agrococcus sediminis]|uniref:WG repeat-containing protein n=1 Tax=Agrococcus sediminis TaxID=2599924 RepID=A0A5M8Q7E1_9MICO|nr:hypothetical protein [Agrococcus sediminis]KAA6430844.1 hypothetical protein FQ330_11745 [Agrococcus sediminis]
MRRWRTKVSAAAVVALVAGLLTVAPPSEPPAAEAAVASNFDPGYIVSDEQFFDGDAMTAAQVQAFLDAQVRTCQSGYTCLKDYRQPTPAMAGSQYCDAIPAYANRTSAQIITDVSRACDISPRALLVLLQKEQSLVTLTAPTAIRYERATGFACPDTAPCDPAFGGFFYQLYNAGRQFQRYAAHPQNWRYRAGQTNQIQYHPNIACGTSPVYIRNQATAGLYVYTPYQPNAAALGNLYGSGDACSAYGNRNFWRMWTDWFGDPREGVASTSMLRDRSNGKVYLISGTARHHVVSREILAEYSPAFGDPRDVDSATLAAYTEGAALSRLVTGTDGAVRLVDDGVSHRFASCSQLQQWQLACTGHPRLSSALQARLPAGEAIAATVVGTDGHDWLIQSGTRRELADVTIPTRYGYAADRVRLDDAATAHLRVGPPVLDSGTAVRNAAGTILRIKSGSGVVALSQAQIQLLPASAGTVFTDASLQQLPATATELPTRLRGAAGAYLLTDGGMLRVDPAKYGGSALFTARTELGTVLQALPSAGSALGPHFVRERGGALYLASGARLQPVADEASYEFIRSRFGVPARIWEVAPRGLDGVPRILDVELGELVRGSDGRVLLWDGSRALHVQHSEFTNALGLPWQVRNVTDDVVRALPAGPAIGGFGFRCASTDLVATDGVLRPYASTTAAAAWRLTHASLDAELCAELTRSSTGALEFIVDESGRTYLMENGQARYVPNRTVLTDLGGTLSGRTPVPASSIALLPKGADATSPIVAGEWVRGPDARIYLWDGTRAMYLAHRDYATALGMPLEWRNLSSGAIAALPKGPTIDDFGYRCGSTDLVSIGGELRPFASATVAAAWRLDHVALSAAVCDQLDRSTAVVHQFVVDPTGRTYMLEGGAARYVPNRTVLAELGGTLSSRTAMSAAAIARLPAGPTF